MSTDAERGRLAGYVWFAAGAAWTLVGLSLVALVVVRNNGGGCRTPRDQPASLRGVLALAALALGMVAVAAATVAAVQVKRRGGSLTGFWIAYLAAAVAPLAAGLLFAIYFRDTFTICF